MSRESDKHVDMTSDMVLLLIISTSKVKIVSGPKKFKIHGHHNLHNNYRKKEATSSKNCQEGVWKKMEKGVSGESSDCESDEL